MEKLSQKNKYDVELIRETEYPMLKGEVYLDHTGTTLYSRTATQRFAEDLSNNLYGNPHSESSSSRLTTERVDYVRKQALDFFRADPTYFDIVFVLNATSAIKLAAELLTYKHQSDISVEGRGDSSPGFWLGYHVDSHTSVIGLRQLADAGHHCFGSDDEVEMWLNTGGVQGDRRSLVSCSIRQQPIRLFAYPGQSNMAGNRLPLDWPGRLRRSKFSEHQMIYTLLDAAALASTAQLDLSNPCEAPDFIAVSFYKIFGFPSLGALIVRKDAGRFLTQRRYFGGGTVEMVICSENPWHSVKNGELHEALEDGTVPFHSIIALDSAMAVHKQLYGSQDNISRHTTFLSTRLYERLCTIHHPNGLRICEIYKNPSSRYGDSRTQGPIIAFNIRTDEGRWLKLSDLEKAASEHHIHLRTGDVCNPGGVAKTLNLQPWELLRGYNLGVRCGCRNVLIGSKPSGIARVSLGAMSNMQDVEKFTTFIRQVFGSNTFHNTPLNPPIEDHPLPQMMIDTILIYPIQGCCAYRVEDSYWPVTRQGLYLDRQWCLVNLDDKTALTQQTVPQLLLIHPHIDLRNQILHINVHRSLWKSMMPQEGIKVSLDDIQHLTSRNSRNSERKPAAVWNSTYERHIDVEISASLEIETFLSRVLGVHCTLAFIVHRDCLNEHLEGSMEDLDRITVTQNQLDFSNMQSEIRLDDDNMPHHIRNISSLSLSSRRAVALAEILRVNVVMKVAAPNLELQIASETWYFLRMGRRYHEKTKVDILSNSDFFHLCRIKSMRITSENQTPEAFSISAPLKKVVWNIEKPEKDLFQNLSDDTLILAKECLVFL